MKTKLFILIISMFLLGVVFVFARFPYSDDGFGFISTGNQTFDTAANFTTNSGCVISGNGVANLTSTNGRCRYINELIDVDSQGGDNYTMWEGAVRFMPTANNKHFMNIMVANTSSDQDRAFEIANNGNKPQIRECVSGTNADIIGVDDDGTRHQMKIIYGDTSGSPFLTVFINGTQRATLAHTKDCDNIATNPAKFIYIGQAEEGTAAGVAIFEDFVSYNGTVYLRQEAAATCDCPASGNWEISDGSTCELTAACDLGTNRLRIIDGALRIMGGGVLRVRLFYRRYSGVIC